MDLVLHFVLKCFIMFCEFQVLLKFLSFSLTKNPHKSYEICQTKSVQSNWGYLKQYHWATSLYFVCGWHLLSSDQTESTEKEKIRLWRKQIYSFPTWSALKRTWPTAIYTFSPYTFTLQLKRNLESKILKCRSKKYQCLHGDRGWIVHLLCWHSTPLDSPCG